MVQVGREDALVPPGVHGVEALLVGGDQQDVVFGHDGLLFFINIVSVIRAPSVAFRRLLQPHVEECLFVPLGDAEHPAGLGYGIRRISFRHLIEIPVYKIRHAVLFQHKGISLIKSGAVGPFRGIHPVALLVQIEPCLSVACRIIPVSRQLDIRIFRQHQLLLIGHIP